MKIHSAGGGGVAEVGEVVDVHLMYIALQGYLLFT